MAYGFNNDKSKVEMYSKSQIDTNTEVDVLYFKLRSNGQITPDAKLVGVTLSLYLLDSEYSATLRRKFRCSQYTFVISEIKLMDASKPSHPLPVSGIFIPTMYFEDSGNQPVLKMEVNTSNAIAATAIEITASASYVKVLAIPNSRITDPIA